jgi:DtxR family Mn-dependent transcriptional regulator
MIKKASETTEEYLECIYRLQLKNGVARTSEIVKSLGVVPGTVTNTVERLERENLVIHVPYKGVKLTDAGREIAVDTLKRHRLAERLLTDILGLEGKEVHSAACKLEHGFSDKVVRCVEKTLGYPETCPHGNLIKTGKGTKTRRLHND